MKVEKYLCRVYHSRRKGQKYASLEDLQTKDNNMRENNTQTFDVQVIYSYGDAVSLPLSRPVVSPRTTMLVANWGKSIMHFWWVIG